MLATMTAIILLCEGGGTAIKPDGATINGYSSEGDSYSGTVSGTRAQGYVDQVDIELDGDTGRIRLPRVVLPVLRGGENGWFELRNLKFSDRAIEANAAINFMNKPKVYLDRMTGKISISGKSGTYAGQCKKVDTASEPQF